MSNYHDDYWDVTGPYTVSFPYASGTTSSGHNPSITFADVTHIVSENTFWDARVSGYYWTGKVVPNSGYTTPVHFDAATGVANGGSVGFGSGLRESRTVAHAKVSHYAADFLGADHEFKFGAQFVDARNTSMWGYPGGRQYVDYEGAPYYALIREPYVYGGQTRGLGAYAEDVLTAGERLSLTLGLRFDRNRAISQDIVRVSVVREDTGETVPGLGALYTWSAFSPRFGFNLKLTADGRTLLHGSWGRFRQGIFVSEPSAVHPGITPLTVAFYDPTTGDYTDIAAVLDPKAQLSIDAGTRSAYTDQLSVGIERELFRDMAVSGLYVHKDGHDFIGWADTVGVYEPGIATLSDGRTVPTYALTIPYEDSLFVLGNREELFLRYNGLLLTFEKRWTDHWQALVSYSLSRSVGLQATNGFSPGTAQISTTFGWNSFGRDPNDYTNATGPLNNDRTHMFRVQGAVEIPKVGVLVGANFQYLTGQPWAAYANVRLPQGSRRIFVETRGARRLSSQTLLDLRLSKMFRFRGERKVEILADLLNSLNETAEVGPVSNNTFSDNFGKARRFVDPLRAMVGVKVSF